MTKNISPAKALTFYDIPELKKAYDILNKLSKKFDTIKNQRFISEAEKYGMAKDVITILELIGEMTDPLFACRDILEEKYFTSISDPIIAREMFLKEYEGLHKPYDNVKNFGWNLYYKVMGLNEND